MEPAPTSDQTIPAPPDAGAGPVVKRGRKPLDEAARQAAAERKLLARKLDRLKASKDVEKMRQAVASLQSGPEGEAPALRVLEGGGKAAPVAPAPADPGAPANWPSEARIQGNMATAELLVSTLVMLTQPFPIYAHTWEGSRSKRIQQSDGSWATRELSTVEAYTRDWAACLAEWDAKIEVSPTLALVASTLALLGAPPAMAFAQKKMTERAAAAAVTSPTPPAPKAAGAR